MAEKEHIGETLDGKFAGDVLSDYLANEMGRVCFAMEALDDDFEMEHIESVHGLRDILLDAFRKYKELEEAFGEYRLVPKGAEGEKGASHEKAE